MKGLAIYAGTFDPITFGHIDIIERAAKLFDQVLIAVAVSETKKTMFGLNERVSMAEAVTSHLKNVQVEGFENLTLELAKKRLATVFIRGLRAVADFDYEFQLANMNRTLNPEIETVFLMPGEKFMFISSSLIREIAILNGDIHPFVPTLVADAIYQKLK